ncbi:MAG: hypothetical protein RLZZ401_224, partial [Pseudomonadota bacterium]
WTPGFFGPSPAVWHAGARRRYDGGQPRHLYAPMDSKLLELLVCPVTKGPLDYVRGATTSATDLATEDLVSRSARLAYPVRDGIPILLESEARPMTPEEVEQLPERTPWA